MADKSSGPKENSPPSAQGISKIEAVRRAMDQLGKEGTPTKIQEFVKKRFGLEITKGHISVCKNEIRKQTAGKKKPPAARGQASNGKKVRTPPAGITKIEAIQQAQ